MISGLIYDNLLIGSQELNKEKKKQFTAFSLYDQIYQ